MKKLFESIEQVKNQNQPIYIRGTKTAGVYLGIYLDWRNIQFEGYIDKNPDEWGGVVYGKHTCFSPEQISREGFVFITACDRKIQKEIVRELCEIQVSYVDDIYSEIMTCIENVDDEFFLKCLFEANLGYKLDLENPRTICEKLQWLKLYDHNPLYTDMVDKYKVKDYVRQMLGDQYVIPALGVWENFDDIDFNKLPNQFVLKCTHDSGSIVVVENKVELDKDKAKAKLNKRLEINYFYLMREWVYKNVKPRIIAEPYISSLGKADSIEYKVTCFNGKVGFVTICKGIAHASFDVRTNDSYTIDFEHMPWYSFYKNSKDGYKKPECWDELISLSEKLAANIPYLRVDWYIVDGKLYFGETTFYTWSGFIEFTPPEWDLRLGECIRLPTK